MHDDTHEPQYAELIERHAKVVRGAIRRALGPRHADLGEDVEQELKLALWKRVQGGKRIEHPVSYLYRAAMTTAWAVLKRQPALGGEVDAERAAYQDTAAESRIRVREILGGLPAEQARALRAYLAGFNHAEVAALYGWTESVARHRIYRGLDALRRRFVEEGAR